MSISGDSGKKKGGWTKVSKVLTCNNRGCARRDEQGSEVFPPLSRLDVLLQVDDGPNERIAVVDRCEYCGAMFKFWVMKKPMERHGYSKAQLLQAIGRTRLTTFTLAEIINGLPDTGAGRRSFNGSEPEILRQVDGYNPDAHIEPKQAELPL